MQARTRYGWINFYSRPCGRGDGYACCGTTAFPNFYSRPCGRGDGYSLRLGRARANFYSRPCGRGDTPLDTLLADACLFLLTPLREGRRSRRTSKNSTATYFYSRPCGRGDLRGDFYENDIFGDFYSRPCGRGDRPCAMPRSAFGIFLLTPLREGRLTQAGDRRFCVVISTHAPAGGATSCFGAVSGFGRRFLLTPLREGRPSGRQIRTGGANFYSRPCGRGDGLGLLAVDNCRLISTHAPAGGATLQAAEGIPHMPISTHAPAGGATVHSR